MPWADVTERARRTSSPQSARVNGHRRNGRSRPREQAAPVTQAYGVGAVLSARARFHVIYRLMVRLNQIADPAGGARTRPWRRLLVASAAVDMATWYWLRRSKRLDLVPRVALDAADSAIWSFAPYPDGSWDYAALPGVPLGVEVGLSRRWNGMVVPLFNAAVTAAVRRARGRPAQPAPFLWQAIAVGGGAGFNHYNRRVQADMEAEADRRRAAKEADAILAGQNAVAMGADTVIDRVQGVAPLLGGPVPGSALHELLDGWKAALASATQRSAAYLGTVLTAWQQGHNTHPNLARRVDFSVEPGHGTVLLTRRQAEALQTTLTRMQPSGELPVRVLDIDAARGTPGRPMTVEVGERRVHIPQDPEAMPRSPDFGPIGLAWQACLFARMTASTAEQVPVSVATPLMAATVAASRVARRRLARRGSDAQAEVQMMALGVSAVATVLATLTTRRPFKPSGGQNFPLYSTMTMPMAVYAFQRQDLSRRMQRIVPVGLVAIAAGGWLLAPRPRQFGQFLLGLTWPLSALFSGVTVSGEFRADARRLAEQLRAREQRAVDTAFERGADSVLELARAAYVDARTQLDQRRGELDPDLVAVAERRLEEVERCLEQIAANGSR